MITPTAQALSGIQYAGSAMNAFGQIIGGNQAKKAADYNASIYEQRAGAARTAASINETRNMRRAESLIGSQRAAYAGAGVSADTGSPIDVAVDSLANEYLDIAIDRYNHEIAASGYEADAAMSRYEGKQARRESTFKAGMTLLEGASRYGMKNRKVTRA